MMPATILNVEITIPAFLPSRSHTIPIEICPRIVPTVKEFDNLVETLDVYFVPNKSAKTTFVKDMMLFCRPSLILRALFKDS